MTRYLLDTTFLIDYLAGSEGVRAFLDAHDGEEFATTAINYKEVAVGWRLNDAFDRQELAATFDWLEVVSFTEDHALTASAFEAELFRDDDPPRRAVDAAGADILIAAVAARDGLTVVTRNLDDFVQFDVPVRAY
ncbi:type II toxin-antitoxin system VapC family toxin [Halorubrum tebenquichense]|uniref:PilT protein domain-containing protein n=1 Tax=Halorubrum tebenquichense DSM 14210 TaxID=1227485 RepID=M0DWI7_9EURY|nr:PIN domain-containing protein [Halorubrum tebenquichense]ELZ38459.1 PilT protein domain-containing protein [Halorubrum tebenquichense DSM 14210]